MKNFVLTLILSLTATLAIAQSVDDLRKMIEAAENEIRIANELLNSTKKEQNTNLRQLTLVRNNISNRKKIVKNLDKQITVISRDVTAKNAGVSSLEKELEQLKAEYADMMRLSYKNYKMNNYMTFLFASKDFNDVTRRIYYIKRYTLVREDKAAEIDSARAHLTREITELSTKKAELDKTVAVRNGELKKLSTDEQEYRRIDQQLGSKASNYNKEIAAKRASITKMQQQIQRIIAEEARKSQGTKRNAAEQDAFIKLSGAFDQNQGRLPYPVSGGIIVDGFGEHPHPTQKGVKVTNTGINIAAAKGAAVKAVFDGEVSRVFSVAGFNNAVMIRHGSYLTVYANLESTTVRAGDKVIINQIIGKISSGNDSDNCFVHFEVWRETQNLDPELWLRR